MKSVEHIFGVTYWARSM